MRKLFFYSAIAILFFLFSGSNLFSQSDWIGIGVNPPSYALDIKGNGSNHSTVMITRTDNSVGWGPNLYLNASSSQSDGRITQANRLLGGINFRSDYGSGFKNSASIQSFNTQIPTSTASGGKLIFYTVPNNSTTLTERMIIDQNGKVGLGISTPYANLDLYTGTNSYDPMLRLKASDNDQIILNSNNGDHTYGEIAKPGDFGLIWNDNESAGKNVNAGLVIAPHVNSGIYSGIRIAANGNVGIGMSDPSTKLHIEGGSDATLAGNGGYLTLGPTSSTHMVLDDGEIMVKHGTISQTLHLQTEGGSILVHDQKPDDHKFRITSAGNVAIGSDMPVSGYKLSVNGKIICTELKVKSNIWADFVFNDDYNLRKLEEVENYIKDNKHLPDVPSEKEVHENGISVGEMDAILLQKIEELTLYTIEQQKRIESLEEIIKKNNL